MKQRHLNLDNFYSFGMKINYHDNACVDLEKASGSHTHDEYEIYINISGDVSFMVEDRIYPIRPGNIIISRPHEYHHCIYHSEAPHHHYCIFFSGKNNEELIETIFGEAEEKSHLFETSQANFLELTALCHTLCEPLENEIEKYYLFFKMLLIIQRSKSGLQKKTEDKQEVEKILEFINKNYQNEISVFKLAETAHISMSTLERWFKDALKTTPSNYITKLRLANAAKDLLKNASVTEAAENNGFSDVSRFIVLFKKHYGMTPYKYKKPELR